MKAFARFLCALSLTAFCVACGQVGLDESFSFFGDCPLLNIPKQFSFTPVTDTTLNTLIISNEVTIECGSNHDIGIGGGEYSINGGQFKTTRGKISSGQRLRVRVRSAATYETTKRATVAIGQQDAILGLFNIAGAKRAAFDVTTKPGDPANAPVVTILSPQDNATVNASRIEVIGQASDPDGVQTIIVNGVNATTTDDYANWQAEVPLVTGTNVLTVASTDKLRNKNPAAAEITIENTAATLVAPKAIESDMANLRLLVVDQTLRALIAISLLDGQHTVLSDETTPDSATPFIEPWKLVINSAGTTAWVLDRAYDDLIQVNLVTGARTLVTDTVGGGEPRLVGVDSDLVLDELNGRIVMVGSFASDPPESLLLSLDLSSGVRTLLSDSNVPNSDNPFDSPVSLALDTLNNRILVMQSNTDPALDDNSILSVDPMTGQRTVVVGNTPGTGDPRDADFDLDNGRVLIVNRFASQVLAFDLTLDELMIAYRSTAPFGFGGLGPIQITRDTFNNRLLLLYGNQNYIGAIDLVTGEATIVY